MSQNKVERTPYIDHNSIDLSVLALSPLFIIN